MEIYRSSRTVWLIAAAIATVRPCVAKAQPGAAQPYGGDDTGRYRVLGADKNRIADNPQLIEVTRDKRVVWTFKSFDVFGNNLVAAKVLRSKD